MDTAVIYEEADNMFDDKRFEKIYSQGTMTVMEIWVDKETGVNYLFHASGYAGGLTPLLGDDGRPIVSDIYYQGADPEDCGQ